MAYIDLDPILEKCEKQVRKELEKCETPPTLAIVTSDSDDASRVYVRNKVKKATELGINAQVYTIPSEYTQLQVEAMVDVLSHEPSVNGIIVQLPLPEKYNAQAIIDVIDPKKDVDGLTTANQGALFTNPEWCYHVPCTPLGILEIIKSQNVPTGAHVVIIGRSNLVGRPLAALLTNNDYTVTLCHSKTKDLYDILCDTDVIVSAVGKPKWLNSGAVANKLIIDVGINRDENGKLCGDVHPVMSHYNLVTPVPKGVGRFTVMSLMYNVAKSMK